MNEMKPFSFRLISCRLGISNQISDKQVKAFDKKLREIEKDNIDLVITTANRIGKEISIPHGEHTLLF